MSHSRLGDQPPHQWIVSLYQRGDTLPQLYSIEPQSFRHEELQPCFAVVLRLRFVAAEALYSVVAPATKFGHEYAVRHTCSMLEFSAIIRAQPATHTSPHKVLTASFAWICTQHRVTPQKLIHYPSPIGLWLTLVDPVLKRPSAIASPKTACISCILVGAYSVCVSQSSACCVHQSSLASSSLQSCRRST